MTLIMNRTQRKLVETVKNDLEKVETEIVTFAKENGEKYPPHRRKQK